MNNSVRKLRCETLEQRQLLSVNPISADAAVVEQALVDQPVTSDAVIDVSSAEKATGDLTFTPQVEGTKSLYNVAWDAIDGAESYIIQKQNDSGAWITYRKTSSADDPTAPTTDAQGLYAGKDATFRVYGVYGGTKKVLDDDGAVVYREGTFSPISISASSATYSPLDEAVVTLKGTDSASAEIHWYSVTGDGDVEITAALNKLSYKPTATESNYDLKVVATGTGASFGSTSEVVFHVIESSITSTYDMTTHKGTLSWAPVDGATDYVVRIWREDLAGYVKYATVTEPTVVVKGLIAANSAGAHTYTFRVTARNNKGAAVGYVAGTVAPISVSTANAAYKAGQEINATIRTAGLVDSVEWFVTDSSEGTQAELADTANDTPLNLDPNTISWTIPGDFATSKIKIVVKGAGLAEGLTAVTVVDVTGTLQAGEFGDYSTVNRNVSTSWTQVADAASYRFFKGRVDDAGSVVWARAATITVDNGEVTSGNATITEDGKIQYTVKMVNVGVEGLYKVAAYDANGKKFDEQEFSYTPFGLELDDDSYQVNAGNLSLAATTIALDGEPTYLWYYSEDGVNWFAEDAYKTSTYLLTDTMTHDSRRFQIKLVATDGERSSVVYAKANDVDNPLDLSVSVTDDNLLNMQFKGVSDATGYQVEYYLSDSEYPVWINLTNVTYVDNGDGTVTATHVNGANYEGYDIRVRALKGDNLWSEWNSVTAYETPSVVVTMAQDIVDPTDGLISLREAVLYNAYLGGDQTITFDATVFDGSDDAVIYLADVTTETVSYPDVYTNARKGGSITSVSGLILDGGDVRVTIDGSNLGESMFVVTAGQFSSTNMTFQNGRGENGGALCFTSQNGRISTDNTLFLNNSASKYGGAVFIDRGGVEVRGGDDFFNTEFRSNTGRYSGAIQFSNSPSQLDAFNCRFIHNTSSDWEGAGAFNISNSGCGHFYNTLFTGNVGEYASVANMVDARIIFTNVTVAGNEQSFVDIYVGKGGEFYSYNSILDCDVYGSRTIDDEDETLGVAYAYHSLYRTYMWYMEEFNYYISDYRPLFTDAANGDYTLAPRSQAIDRGSDEWMFHVDSRYKDTDLAGNPRPVGGNVDAGAYEFQTSSSDALLDEAFVDFFEDEFDF